MAHHDYALLTSQNAAPVKMWTHGVRWNRGTPATAEHGEDAHLFLNTWRSCRMLHLGKGSTIAA